MLATWFITRQLEYFGGTMGNLTLKGKVTLGMVRNSIFNKEIQNNSDVQQLIIPSLALNLSTFASIKFLFVHFLSHTCSSNSSKEFKDPSLWQHGCKD